MPISQDQFNRIAKDLPGMGSDPQSVRKRVRPDHGAQFAGLRPRPGASHESCTYALDTQPIPLAKATLEKARSWAVQRAPNGPNSIASAVMP